MRQASSRDLLPEKLRSQIAPWRETEIKEIHSALSKAQGDKIIAAALLGIGKTTIYRKLKNLGVEHSDSAPFSYATTLPNGNQADPSRDC